MMYNKQFKTAITFGAFLLRERADGAIKQKPRQALYGHGNAA